MKGLPRSNARAKAENSAIKKVRIKLDHQISVVAAGAGIGFGSVVVGGLPQAYLKLLSAAVIVTFTGPTTTNLTDTWDGDFGVGSTPADDATITGTDVNFIASTALGAATAEVSPTKVVANGVDFVLDNTDGSLELNLNLLVDAANITDATTVIVTARGYLEVCLITMLDD
jgi:hypothetical protein